jgi:carbonic anhydrase
VKKVFHFDSPREHYQSDAAVLWCFDHRFDLAFQKFLKRSGVTITDVIKIAGGAKTLVSPEQETDREFVLDQILKSTTLHATQRVILMVHSDCGAYGGLAAFRGDTAAEAAHHEGELQRAAANLKAAFPDLQVEGYFVDFEGVWDAEIGSDKASSGAAKEMKEPVA